MSARYGGALAALACLLLAGGCATASRGPEGPRRDWDWGPIASRQTAPDGTERIRALGPVVETVRAPDGSRLTAVRPFFARETDAASGWEHTDWLWPVGESKRLEGGALSWRLLTAYGRQPDPDDPHGRWRLWVLPLYFQGRDAQGRGYLAVFPVGGRVRDFLTYDEAVFALWPLWSRTRRGATTTHHALWPVVSWTDGPGIRRARVFPLYGVGHYRQWASHRFVLWPLWSEARYHQPPPGGYGFLAFPLYGRVRRGEERSDSVLPPFFRLSRSPTQTEVTAPWPIVRIRRGDLHETTVWPLFGHRRREGIAEDSLLWFFFQRERIDRGAVEVERWRAVPVLTVETHHARDDARPPVREVRVWPLLSYRRRGEAQRFRLLELWPARGARPVERSWAPFWTLLDVRAEGDARETELLWGLYRRRVRAPGQQRTSLFPLIEWDRCGPEERGWQVLKGLAGYRREGADRRLRLFYAFSVNLGGDDAP